MEGSDWALKGSDGALVVLKGNLGGSSEVLEGLDGASGGSQGHLGPELALSILLSAMDVKLDSTYYMQDTKTLLNKVFIDLKKLMIFSQILHKSSWNLPTIISGLSYTAIHHEIRQRSLIFLWNGMGPPDAQMGPLDAQMGPQGAQMGPQEAQMWPAKCGGSNGILKKFCLGLWRFV